MTDDEDGDPATEAALAVLAAEDPNAARLAEAAADSLTSSGEMPLSELLLRELIEFLYYRLPTKWLVDLTEHQEVARALGRLFGILDMPRHAALCSAPDLHPALTAYGADDRSAGVAALRKALDRSGVEPPDTETLAWGSLTGMEEARAGYAVSASLQAALEDGTLTPGGRGWRDVAARLTVERLTMPDLGQDLAYLALRDSALGPRTNLG